MPLAPGDNVNLPGTSAAENSVLGGFVINDNTIIGDNLFMENPAFAMRLNLQNRVVRSDETGGLIFSPRILFGFNVTFHDFTVDAISLYGFNDYSIDANYLTDGLGDRGPTSVDRSEDGNQLDFTFEFPLTIGNLAEEPQEESYFLGLTTEATAFANTGSASIFVSSLTTVSGETTTYRLDYNGLAVPVTPVDIPAPSSALLFLGGFGLMVLLRRWRI